MANSRYSKVNFICPKCHVKYPVYVWSDRKENPLCPECTTIYKTPVQLEEIVEDKPEVNYPSIGGFSNLSLQDKQKSLKARATAHYKKEILPEIKDDKL